MAYKEKIVVNPDILLGKPIIKGTRITVEIILRKLSEGMSVNENHRVKSSFVTFINEPFKQPQHCRQKSVLPL